MLNEIDIKFCEKAWELGDWTSFVDLIELPPSNNEENIDLACMFAGAALFLESKELSEKMINKAFSLSKCDKVKFFILSVYESQLGQVAMLADRHQLALHHFRSSFKLGGKLIQSLFYNFYYKESEYQLQRGEAEVAIQAWQDLASILQEDTPEVVYHRMSHCYSVNQKGFGGTQDENYVSGDCNKHDLLEFFHIYLQPDFYFEIGVDEGFSLARARCKALGVDARPELNLKVDLPGQAQILGVSSDAFFREQAADFFTTPPDLAFIDGMHLFEFALRDFINVERYAASYALVGIDDIFPCHPVQAERRRRSSAWTGDIWKLIPILQKYRPDLTLISLPCSTTGLLLIAGLDKNNTCLLDNYDEIIHEYQSDLSVPDNMLRRSDSISSDHPVVSMLLSTLKQSKKEHFNVKQVQERLFQLAPFIEQAKIDKCLPHYPKTLEILSIEQARLETQIFQAQLYLPLDKDLGYSEKKTQVKNLLSSGEQHCVYFFCQALERKPLRFDPSRAPGLFEIKDILLCEKDSDVVYLYLSGKEQLGNLLLGGDCFLLANPDKYLLYAYAADPIVFLPVVKTPEVELKLRVSIRKISDKSEMRECWKKHLGRDI